MLSMGRDRMGREIGESGIGWIPGGIWTSVQKNWKQVPWDP